MRHKLPNEFHGDLVLSALLVQSEFYSNEKGNFYTDQKKQERVHDFNKVALRTSENS